MRFLTPEEVLRRKKIKAKLMIVGVLLLVALLSTAVTILVNSTI